MALTKAFLVDPEVPEVFELSLLKPTLNGPLHYPVHLIPREAGQKLRLYFAAYGEKHVDCEGLEQGSEARAIFGPGNPHLPDPMLCALASGYLRLDKCFPLHGIEMAPSSRPRVVAGHHRLAFRAVKQLSRRMLHLHGDLSQFSIGRRRIHLHRGDPPGWGEAK